MCKSAKYLAVIADILILNSEYLPIGYNFLHAMCTFFLMIFTSYIIIKKLVLLPILLGQYWIHVPNPIIGASLNVCCVYMVFVIDC